MDGETYVVQDPSLAPARQYFHSADTKLVATPKKVKGLSKFPTKYLVWQVMDQFGNDSKPYVSRSTKTAKIYFEKCLKGMLISFI